MHLFIYNPLAGAGRGQKAVQAAVRHLACVDYDVVSIFHLPDDLAVFLEGYPSDIKVILIGGDGTLNFFINRYGVQCLQHPIYFYSYGTGNDFQKNFSKQNIPLLDLSKPMDLLTIQAAGQTFKAVNALGVGLDGLVVKFCQYGKRIRRYTYSFYALWALFRYRPASIILQIDGVEHQFKHCWLVTVGNGQYMGSGMRMTPKAHLDDGLLDVCVVHCPSRWILFRHFFSIFQGKHLQLTDYVFYQQAKKVEYQADTKQYLQYDGELFTSPIIEFSVSIE